MEKTITPSSGSKTFIYFRGALGDNILFLPVLAAFFENCPEDELTLACPVEVFRVLLPIVLPQNRLKAQGANGLSTPKLIHHTEARFRHFFDLNQYEPWPSELTALLADHSRRIWVTGDPNHSLKNKLVTLKLPGENFIHSPFPILGESVRKHHEGLIRKIGWTLPGHIRLSATRPRSRPRKILIHPGSGSALKNWPLKNFLALAKRLSPFEISLLFGPADGELLEECRREGYKGIIHSELPLSETAECLAANDVYVGNDSGISHLAVLLGVPSLVICLRSGSGFWDPLPNGVSVLWTSDPTLGPEVEEAAFLVFKLCRD